MAEQARRDSLMRRQSVVGEGRLTLDRFGELLRSEVRVADCNVLEL